MKKEEQTQRIEQTLTVVADVHERSSGVIDALRKLPDVDVSVNRLPVGDYRVDNLLLIERKHLIDFALSVRTGRAFEQASRLQRQRMLRACFILEGRQSDLRRCCLPRQSLQGAVVTLALVFGIPILRSRSWNESATLIRMAGRQMLNRVSKSPVRYGAKPRARRRIQLLMLQTVSGIGPTRAKSLLDHFGNLESLISASSDDFADVSGIGRKTAERLEWAFGPPART
jgi:ERCC4-type nuclease